MKRLFIILCFFVSLQAKSQDDRRIFVDSLLRGIEIKKDIRYNITERPLLLDIYYPARTKNELLPCVVWIHGGALTDTSIQKDYDLIRWGIARTTFNGYISVSIDYRLITESPLPTAIQDCQTAIRFLKSNAKKYGIDTTRMAVVGESAGGYLAGFCSFACNTNVFKTTEWSQVSNKIACGVLWYPAVNHDPYNMIDYIDRDDIPVISIHGDADKLVPIDRSYQIQNKCREFGLDFQLHIIKNAQHGFFDTSWTFNDNNCKYMEEAIGITLAFLDAHFKIK
ncbi:MAG: alpha/beta hydrolase [Candidatus Gastranaerophilales bacterium]|nr:alpha/beta hydrolase [Candidatus Gastranaerophilales bacterium]